MIYLAPFKNESHADFSDERNARGMLTALERVEMTGRPFFAAEPKIAIIDSRI